MDITREQVSRLLRIDNKQIAKFIESGKLEIVKVGYGGRKYYDMKQVEELARELKKPKEL